MSFFFFNDTATTEIYTLSLHDALPIYRGRRQHSAAGQSHRPRPRRRPQLWWRESRTADRDRRHYGSLRGARDRAARSRAPRDRKSTRLNSSHLVISYAVFCLKKKKDTN